jgi:hypothetical protein
MSVLGRWLRSPPQTQARVDSFHGELAYFTGLEQFVKTKIHAQAGDECSNRNEIWSVIALNGLVFIGRKEKK